MTLHVCLASSFPERLNRNLSIVDELADGFRSVLHGECVSVVPYYELASHVVQSKPRLLILVGSALLPQCDYRELGRACRTAGTIFAFWTVEDPYEFDAHYKFAHEADLVFSNDAWACQFYSRDCVYHLPTAASKRFMRSLAGYERRSLDVFFCGVGFHNRRRLIEDALPILERRRTLILGENWDPHPAGMIANRRLSRTALFEHYGAAKFVLNIGRDFSFANARLRLPAVTPGPRTFEAAMIGCVQLYFQPSRFLANYFEPEKEVVTFDSIEQLDCQIERLMQAPQQATAIAQAAQTRAMNDHTYASRARTILFHAGLSASTPAPNAAVEELADASVIAISGPIPDYLRLQAEGAKRSPRSTKTQPTERYEVECKAHHDPFGTTVVAP